LRLAAALCILLSSSLAGAQGAVKAGEDLPVQVDVALPLVEPYLAIHPKDPAILVAAAMAGHPDGSYGALVFSSQDGGRTWQKHDPGIRDGADVWTEFLADGTAVFSTGAEDSTVKVFRSRDNGRTWSPPTVLEGAHDHPMLAVAGGSLYLISSGNWKGPSGRSRDAVLAARSTDGGATFSEPGRAIVSNLRYEAHDSAVSSEGALLVGFADHGRPGERRRLERQRDWLLVSEDSGRTFFEPLLISETCDGRGGWSSLALNLSDRLAPPDRLFHVCAAAQFDGIQLRYSDTFGEIWSTPVRVDRPGNVTPYSRTPAIAVNKDGVVGVAWSDGRGDGSTIKGSFRCTEIFFAASLDGGATFLPEVKVSSGKSCPAAPENVGVALRFPAGGEYMGLAAAADGTFRLLWADSRSGIYQLRIATVSVEVPSSGASPPPASP
jgi:hypothetical protein